MPKNKQVSDAGLRTADLVKSGRDQTAAIERAPGIWEKGGLATRRQRIIDERIAEDGPLPTVAELAGLCRISARHLGRGFRLSRGCSIGDHLANVRVEVAKRKLATSESIQNIAASLGYATQSSFTVAFRKSTGTTPGSYRDRVHRPLPPGRGGDGNTIDSPHTD